MVIILSISSYGPPFLASTPIFTVLSIQTFRSFKHNLFLFLVEQLHQGVQVSSVAALRRAPLTHYGRAN